MFSRSPQMRGRCQAGFICVNSLYFFGRIVRICRWTLIFAMECRRDWLRLVQAYKLQCIARGLLKYKM